MLHNHNPYIAHYARAMVIRLSQNILRSFDYLFSFRCLKTITTDAKNSIAVVNAKIDLIESRLFQ